MVLVGGSWHGTRCFYEGVAGCPGIGSSPGFEYLYLTEADYQSLPSGAVMARAVPGMLQITADYK